MASGQQTRAIELMGLVHCLPESQPSKLARPLLQAVDRVRKAEEELKAACKHLDHENKRINDTVTALWNMEEITQASARLLASTKDWEQLTRDVTH
jgi:hypothetical protein